MLKITATGNLTNDVELKMNETTGKPYGKSCEADAVRPVCSGPAGQSGIPEKSI